MNISFQHTNPAAGHESTLLRVTPDDEDSYWFLIDAGDSVSPTAFLGPDTTLDGVFLTHAHTDHYVSLSHVLANDGDTPLYTSPATATVLELVYAEADRYRNLGTVDAITEALTPIDTWTTLADGVYVLPVPAGHTPGATGFLFRIDDPQNQDTITVLATGDFTTRPVAGYPGLTIPDSIAIDVLIANATTTDDFEATLSTASEILLERALGGATTLVATSGLTGVHIAYLLGYLVDELDRQLTVHLVGQAAKLYTALDYDVPFVTTHAHFEHTDEVLAPGAITIAGPEAPTQGSTSRLYGVIEDNPDAVFVQLTTSDVAAADGAACATHYFALSNHPTEAQFIETVDANLPRQFVLKHVPPEQAKSLGASFENLFHWTNDDTREHVLYEDGAWPAPPWVSDGEANRIRRRNYQDSGSRLVIDRPLDQLPEPPVARQSPALATEGLDVPALTDQFVQPSPQQPAPSQAPTTAGSDGETAPAPPDEATNGGGASDIESNPASSQPEQADTEFQSGVIERLDALETSLDELTADMLTEDAIETDLDALGTRVGEVEATLETLADQVAADESPTVPGTVLRQDALVLVRVDTDALAETDLALEHEQEVELTITAVQRDRTESS